MKDQREVSDTKGPRYTPEYVASLERQLRDVVLERNDLAARLDGAAQPPTPCAMCGSNMQREELGWYCNSCQPRRSICDKLDRERKAKRHWQERAVTAETRVNALIVVLRNEIRLNDEGTAREVAMEARVKALEAQLASVKDD